MTRKPLRPLLLGAVTLSLLLTVGCTSRTAAPAAATPSTAATVPAVPAATPTAAPATITPMPAPLVVMVGAVTATTAELRAVFAEPPSGQVTLDWTPPPGAPATLKPSASLDRDRVAIFRLQGLSPNTAYRYQVTVGAEKPSAGRGEFRTFPPEGTAASFQFAVGCGVHPEKPSSFPVFTTALRHQPLFYLNHGDFIYSNIDTNDPERFRVAWRKALGLPTQAELMRHAAFAYVWDDHDSGPNNCDRTALSRPAARAVYRELFPHYPLAAGDGDAPIQQTFGVGRTLFVMTDLRSERDPASWNDSGEKSMLGKRQREWLKQTLLAARDQYAVIFWVSSVPFLSPQKASGDNWDGYTTERTELMTFFKQHRISNLVIVCGDAHMLGADDGEGTAGYAEGGNFPIPVLQCGPLGSNGSFKGGPVYNRGHYVPPRGTGPACFALISVEDRGPNTPVRVRYSGRTQDDEEKVACTLTIPKP